VPTEIPGSAVSFIISPLPFALTEKVTTVLDDDWDGVCLEIDLVDCEEHSKKHIWAKAHRCVLALFQLLEVSSSLHFSVSLVLLGFLSATAMFYFGVPLFGFWGPQSVNVPHVSRPEIQVGAATLVGTSYGRVDGFMGIPFAKPP
jgi:hypothetical protein